MLGGAWGTTQAFVPAFEASVAWKQFDFYIEAEYVRDSHQRDDSYFYAWSELGVRPVEWLRVGIAGQRTTTYGNDREFQRGPFAQVTWGPVTIGGYWFNPGSTDQVFVGMIGARSECGQIWLASFGFVPDRSRGAPWNPTERPRAPIKGGPMKQPQAETNAREPAPRGASLRRRRRSHGRGGRPAEGNGLRDRRRAARRRRSLHRVRPDGDLRAARLRRAC